MENKEAVSFSKDQILSSKQFEPVEKDFLNVLLDDSQTYTVQSVKDLLKKEFKRVVV